MILRVIIQSLALLLMAGCTSSMQEVDCQPPLGSINIIDRNGLSETISNPDRLKQFNQVDFLCPQPYQKVLRTLKRDSQGNIRAFVTSYHPNGQLKQYLEVLNNRAYGWYREWFANGVQKVDTFIVGGDADLNSAAEKSWIFDGVAKAWDDEGNLIAEIPYDKGELSGMSIYYHPSGAIWKKIPYTRGNVCGTFEIYLENGSLFQTTTYINGKRNGLSQRFWPCGSIAANEEYCDALLLSGQYFDSAGKQFGGIVNGEGRKALFGKITLEELQDFHGGVLNGRVDVFAADGTLTRTYQIHNDLKNGEEIEYFPGAKKQPHLSINWISGKIQGVVRTWYPNGTMESQREMSQNSKNGLLRAWYTDGNLMLLEEYDRDRLVKGDYFKRGDRIPITQVQEGKGLATIFDPQGNFLRRIQYYNGKPLE